jgi:hypothetical protein
LATKLLEPTITEPTGAPKPFDRHTWFKILRLMREQNSLIEHVSFEKESDY